MNDDNLEQQSRTILNDAGRMQNVVASMARFAHVLRLLHEAIPESDQELHAARNAILDQYDTFVT